MHLLPSKYTAFILMLSGLLLICRGEQGQAQATFRLQLHPLDTTPAFLEKHLKYQSEFKDTALVFNELSSIVQQLRGQAWLAASVDSLVRGDSLFTAYLYLGLRVQWASLRNGNVEEAWLAAAGFRQKTYEGKPLDWPQIERLKERLLEQAENNGYPFASVRLDSLQWADGGRLTAHGSRREAGRSRQAADGSRQSPITNHQSSITAQIFLDKNQYITFDSLTLLGDARISATYLRNYLGIRAGEPYSRRKVLNIQTRLRELPFVREKRSTTVHFRFDRANLRLHLEKKKASRFDFLVGFLPSSQRAGGQKLLITGTANAEILNGFGRGERLLVAFERLRPQTQKLELAATYPYLLELPFGLDARFFQYKRDSTYSDVVADFGLQYLLEGGNYLKAFWNLTASNLLSVDTNALKQGRFPDLLDVRNSGFGLELSLQCLDYRFNPRKGWGLLLKGSAGLRRIEENQAILSISENFYDTLPGKTFRFLAEAGFERFFPIGQRSTLKVASRNGAIFSEEPVFQNEQYRLGGNRLLRGFDEESLFATLFSVATLEFRLLVGQNSFFYLFGDGAYLEDRRSGRPTRYERLLGFGGGLTFETGAGVFGIGLAVGKREGEPTDFSSPKVHFGYVNYF